MTSGERETSYDAHHGSDGSTYLVGYAVASLLTGQRHVWLGDLAQLIPPLGFAGLCIAVGRQSTGQVRVFWNLNAAHAVIWATAQGVWTYYDTAGGGVPIISPTDPIFFLSSIPLGAALYRRPERDRPRWLFDIILLDIVLIGLFAAFAYIYFVVSLAVTGGSEDVYHANPGAVAVRNTQAAQAASSTLRTFTSWVRQARQWRRLFRLGKQPIVVRPRRRERQNGVGHHPRDVPHAAGRVLADRVEDVVDQPTEKREREARAVEPEHASQELYSRACQIRQEMARRFIFITGDIDSEDTLEFLESSRCGYFMKPFNLERLTSAVEMLVGGD